jgi:hypothetical protein
MEARMTGLERHLWAALRLVADAPMPAAVLLAKKSAELDRVAGMLGADWRDGIRDRGSL